ncbi:MAG TPA: 2OG-Fe(II) oxygenase [Acidimicrobiales bacterium]|nr:2OG-Fe(II) oxygenase [Acidimicrobiales bacterium]
MGSSITSVISPKWLAHAHELFPVFESASPFPHLVLDDFLVEDQARAMLSEFPSEQSMPNSRDYVFAAKRELSSIEGAGPACLRFYQAVISPEFTAFLGDLTGLELFVDPAFHGGGFHQGGDGSFLDMHVDFNIHPMHNDWRRMLNILVYLCPDWDPAWGGDLLIKRHVQDEPMVVPVGFNRAVIMRTADDTYHGFRRMQLPAGVTRKSVATYAYELVGDRHIPAHTTRWVPEEAGAAKRALARHYDAVVGWKQRLMPSRTAKNR